MNKIMNTITKSASKLVLLYIVMILGILALFAGIWAVIHGSYGEAEKLILSMFGSAITFLFGFYFGYKGDTQKPATPSETETSSFAGK